MLETKTETPRRDIFARKGEAMPTPSVEAGLKPNSNGNGLTRFLPNNDEDEALLGPERLVTAAALSSLVTRDKPRANVAVPETFRSEPAPELPLTGVYAPETRRRHSFTVRLKPKVTDALMELAEESDRTYQDILETAVRHYLNRSIDTPEADRVGPHWEPAAVPQSFARLIHRG